MLLVLSAVAWASDLDVTSVVDVNAPAGSVSLAPGGSENITINMTVTGKQDGTATFEVYRDWTLSGGTFTGSNPQTFTVNPQSAGTTTNFNASGTVAASAGQSTGVFTLTVGAFVVSNSNQMGAKLAAGDTADYEVTVAAPADATPPVITPTISGTLGDNGWYVSDVTVSWTVLDDESAITSTSGCGPTTVNIDTLATTLTCTATSGGGMASESVTIKRDATDPTITSWSNGPQNGASYYYGSVPAEPTCTATDNLSGVTDAGCAVSGYGTTVGSHTMTASAADEAGNDGSETRTYQVLAWTIGGFYQPVEMSGGETIWNVVKGGSTVPLKFEVFAGSTELTDTSIVKSFTTTKVACSVGGTDDPVDFTSTGGTSLRYDGTAGQFVQNWQTPKGAGTCYRVTLTTQDGSQISASFKTK